MAWGSAPDSRQGEPDEEYPDYLWPDEDDNHDDFGTGPAGRTGPMRRGVAPDNPVPSRWGEGYAHDARGSRGRILALAVTGVIAAGLGAAGVLAYRDANAGSAPAASASQSAGLLPGLGGGPAGQGGAPGGQGIATQLQLVGKVAAVGPGTITLLAGPTQRVTAEVTGSTRFTGSVRTLSGIRVGDIVAAQVTIVNGVARVVSLQDPASQS